MSLPPLRIGYSQVDSASLLNQPDVLAVIGFDALFLPAAGFLDVAMVFVSPWG